MSTLTAFDRLPRAVPGPLSSLFLVISTAVLSFELASVGPTYALPAGRAWARPEAYLNPGLDPSRGIPVLDVGSAGVPVLYTSVEWSSAYGQPTRFTWGDSTWRDPISCIPFNLHHAVPSLSLVSSSFLVWPSSPQDALYYTRMVVASLDGVCAPAETVMATTGQDYEYGAAGSAVRRWVARAQQRIPLQTTGVRVAYSDTVGMWHEVHDVGIDDGMCDIAPVNDTTAIVAYAGESGLAWALLRGGAWADSGNIDSRGWWARHPRFRFRPSGGLWLVWPDDRDRMHISRYVNGQMFRGDSIIVPRPPGDTYTGAWCAASRDTAERPTLVWEENGYAYTYRDVIAISVPNDSGWDYGEEVPGSEGGNIPAVTRDRNGDVWVMWRNLRMGTTGMTHSYTAVTCSAPQVQGQGRDRVVTWQLSVAAPHAWWAVLRAHGEGEFEQVARLESGHDSLLSWTDHSPPFGILRYKIRRECLDSRYVWLSEEGRWPPKAQRPIALGPIPSPSSDSIVLQVADAVAGEAVATLYDIQGRVVRAQRLTSSGAGHDSFRLDLARSGPQVRAGIYFLRVEDASGNVSNAAKVVFLR